MIQYTLKCSQDHRFESWFQSADAFDKLRAAGMVACTVCGATDVEKAMMAPRVRPARTSAKTAEKGERPLATPTNESEQALAALRKTVEENSDYVGKNFAKEARDMHDGLTPERAIYGEAKLEDAKALVEDGVPVMPLPFRATRKSN